MAVAVTFPEVAVMVTCPTPPCPSVGLQLMMLASHTPPHTRPPLEMVAMLLLLLVNVMSAAMVLPAEFWAEADSVPTSPSLSERVVGKSMMVLTVVLAELPPPPHPASKTRTMAVKSAARQETTGNRRMYPPRRTGIPADL